MRIIAVLDREVWSDVENASIVIITDKEYEELQDGHISLNDLNSCTEIQMRQVPLGD